jgi:heme/copper-type cytochrome/quinol oxidase subunit 2
MRSVVRSVKVNFLSALAGRQHLPVGHAHHVNALLQALKQGRDETAHASLPISISSHISAVVALVVNVASAMVLMKYRTGDANVRAVWLFSRNDALGNLAVVIAAAVIAVLFLHSASEILRDSLRELRADKPVSASPQSK